MVSFWASDFKTSYDSIVNLACVVINGITSNLAIQRLFLLSSVGKLPASRTVTVYDKAVQSSAGEAGSKEEEGPESDMVKAFHSSSANLLCIVRP